MGIFFRKDILDKIPTEEGKILTILDTVNAIEKRKKEIIESIRQKKNPMYEELCEPELQKLCKEADEMLKAIENIEHKQKKDIEKRLQEIKKR